MRMIGPFEIHEVVARGGHATVHAAAWPGRQGPALVAKVAQPGSELRLHHENVALRSVQHPNVITPVALVDDGDEVALVLPRAVCSLRAHTGRLDEGQALGVAVSLAEGLAALHRAGLVHGDVTPGNVVLLADGTPQLADLGVSAESTASRVEADAVKLAETVLDAMRSPGSPVGEALRAHVNAGGDTASLVARLRDLDVVARAVDPHAAPPLPVEPPTVVVD